MDMTPEGLDRAVAHVRAIADDDEAAHIAEDKLYTEVLRHIAANALEPWSRIATQALKTKDIQFERWCS